MAKGEKDIVVPLHKELDIGTLKSIINQSGLTRNEFLSIIKKNKNNKHIHYQIHSQYPTKHVYRR